MSGIDIALYIKHSTTRFEEFLFIGRIVWVLRRLEVRFWGVNSVYKKASFFCQFFCFEFPISHSFISSFFSWSNRVEIEVDWRGSIAWLMGNKIFVKNFLGFWSFPFPLRLCLDGDFLSYFHWVSFLDR